MAHVEKSPCSWLTTSLCDITVPPEQPFRTVCSPHCIIKDHAIIVKRVLRWTNGTCSTRPASPVTAQIWATEDHFDAPGVVVLCRFLSIAVLSNLGYIMAMSRQR